MSPPSSVSVLLILGTELKHWVESLACWAEHHSKTKEKHHSNFKLPPESINFLVPTEQSVIPVELMEAPPLQASQHASLTYLGSERETQAGQGILAVLAVNHQNHPPSTVTEFDASTFMIRLPLAFSFSETSSMGRLAMRSTSRTEAPFSWHCDAVGPPTW